MRTLYALAAAISVVSLAGFGLLQINSPSAGTEDSRLTKAEFILKADSICRDYYEKAGPDAATEARNFSGQAEIIGRVMPYYSHAVRGLKALSPPAEDEGAIADYIGSLDRSSDLAEKLRDSERLRDIKALRDYSQDAIKESFNQKMAATRYGFKVCSVASTGTVRAPGRENPQVPAARA